MSYIDFVTDYNALIAAYARVHKVSGWKASAQKAGINLLKVVQDLSSDLNDGTYQAGDGSTFKMCERGNLRLVRALNVRDTIAQQSLCQSLLIPIHSLEHDKIDKNLLTGEKMLPKSLGIGSPLSQIAGIFFPTRIDTYCKTVKSLHCYDAYMDDRIILHPDKAYLKELKKEIETLARTMGLFVHPHKTQIIKLSHGVTFLKTKYLLTETGHIVRRIPHDTLTRQRRKMKRLALLVAAGDLSYSKFTEQYSSWRGDKDRYDAYVSIRQMDDLYRRLKQ